MIQIADLDVLDNNILTGKGQTLALDDTLRTNAQDSLVRSNLYRILCSLVVSNCLFDLTSVARIEQDALAFVACAPARTYERQQTTHIIVQIETYKQFP